MKKLKPTFLVIAFLILSILHQQASVAEGRSIASVSPRGYIPPTASFFINKFENNHLSTGFSVENSEQDFDYEFEVASFLAFTNMETPVFITIESENLGYLQTSDFNFLKYTVLIDKKPISLLKKHTIFLDSIKNETQRKTSSVEIKLNDKKPALKLLKDTLTFTITAM